MKKHEAQIQIDGVSYSVKIVNGERFINDLPIDEFLQTLPVETVVRLAKVGFGTMQGETEPQARLSELEFLDY